MAFVQKSLRQDGGFGANLRELRELRGLSRHALAERTQIHASMIRAFEEEKLFELKDPVYAERHVRALVDALEGRPGYFLKKYRELSKSYQAERKERMRLRPSVRKRDLVVSSRVIAMFGFGAVIVGAGLYLGRQAYVLRDPPPLEVDVPAENATLDRPFVEIRGRTVPNAVVTVNGRRAVVEDDGAFTMRFDVPRGPTILTIRAERRYGSSATVIRRVTYAFEERGAVE